jgi:fructokinase
MNDSSPPLLGVDLGGTKVEAIALDVRGRTLWRKRMPTPAGDYGATVAAVAVLVAEAEHDLAVSGCTVGVGTPGTPTADGRMKNCNSTWLNGMPLPADLERALGRSVRIANDANCLALSEATDGAGAGADVVFAAILGTGVGAGIFVQGNVLAGPNGVAGEWGHNQLPWADGSDRPEPACYCGQHGCLETWLSGPGLARDHLEHGGAELSAADIARSAIAGDAACAATLQRHASRLARGLAQVINLLDPQVIVLGGGLSQVDSLYETVPRLWSSWVFSGGVREPVRTRLVRSVHGDSSGVRGAAWLWRPPQA